jgi:hypothetical protein
MAALLGGCAAADPTGGLLGDAPDDLIVSNSDTERQRCPSGETLMCETRSPNRVSDGRYGFRSNRMQQRCACHPDRYINSMIRETGGLGMQEQ